jgi:hypothetical protein
MSVGQKQRTKMKSFFGTIFAAVAAFHAAFGITGADVSVADFPRLAGESGDAARIMRAVEKAGGGGVVWFPRGEYEIDSMIIVSNRSSLLLHKSAHLKAVKKMPFVLKYFGRLREVGKDGVTPIVDHNLFIKGGDIDGMGLAGCAHVMGLRHFTMANTTFRNGKGVGLQFGDPTLPRTIESGYEIIANNLYFICNKSGLAGNVGLLTYIGDSHFTDIVVVDYTTGIRDMRSSNHYTRCHVWGGIVKKTGTKKPEMLENSVAFDLRGVDSVLTDCYADTAMTGFWVRQDARIFNCSYYNNWLFKMDNPTVFRHDNGRLIVTGGRFSKNSPKATLYAAGKGAGELVWRDNYTIKFSAADRAGLSAKLRKAVRSNAAAVDNLAGNGN